MSEFKDDDEDFFGADGGSSDGGSAVNGIDLSEGDLTSGVFKDIPVGTWLHVKFYDVTPGTVKSGNNFGKPKYQIAFMTAEDETEYGENRKFTVFANLFGKAFFIAFPILKAVGMAPTKDNLAPGKGAFFSAKDSEEFPDDFPLTDPKLIPAGSYVFPAPSELVGKHIWALVGEYSGDNSGFKRFASKAAALAAKDDEGNKVNVKAYPQLTEFLSETDYEKLVAKREASMGAFKGDA